MNRIERWQRMAKDAELAFPAPLQRPLVTAIVQYDNGKIGISADRNGMTVDDALALAEWILDVCADEADPLVAVRVL